MKYLIGIMAVVTSVALFAPATGANLVNRLSTTVNSWSEKDCSRNPQACLQIKEAELKRLRNDLIQTEGNVGEQLHKVREVRENNAALIAANAMFLERGKTLLQATPTGQPVIWLGKRYETKEDFTAQLSILFAEKQRLQTVQGDAVALIEQMTKTRERLIARRSEVEAAISVMPAKMSLLTSQTAIAQLEDDLAAIDGIIEGASTSATDTQVILRSTQELVQDAQLSGQSVQETTDFESWLSTSAG